jgi:hypothetical protein
VVKEIIWTRLIYLGRRGDVSAWRAEEEGGGVVLFLVPVHDLEVLVLGLRLHGRVVGADRNRHAEMLEMFMGGDLGRQRPDLLVGVTGILHPPMEEPEE